MKLKESEKCVDLGISNLRLIQNTDYFCFGTDSVMLANFMESNSSKNIILDLCSGSGVIPFIIYGKKKYKKIYGVELQQEMYDLFIRNIALNKTDEKIKALNCNIKDFKYIKEYILEERVDIITCNPPYKKNGTGILSEGRVKYVAKHEIECTLEDIFVTSSKLLNNKGKLYLVHKPERVADLICLARKYNFEPKKLQFVFPRIDLKPSIVLIEYVRNGGNELKILEPIIE